MLFIVFPTSMSGPNCFLLNPFSCSAHPFGLKGSDPTAAQTVPFLPAGAPSCVGWFTTPVSL